MSQEELQQQNEKRNQRLTKAIEVFKEQKENIARLTEERDKARLETKEAEARVEELSKKLEEKSESDEKFFEQVNEIQVLEKRTEKLKADCEQAYEDLGNAQERIKSLEADNSNLDDSLNYEKIEHEKTAAELEHTKKEIERYKNSLDDATADYETIREKYSLLVQTNDEQKENIENLQAALDKVNDTLNNERKQFKDFMGRLIDKEDELHKMLTTAGA